MKKYVLVGAWCENGALCPEMQNFGVFDSMEYAWEVMKNRLIDDLKSEFLEYESLLYCSYIDIQDSGLIGDDYFISKNLNIGNFYSHCGMNTCYEVFEIEV